MQTKCLGPNTALFLNTISPVPGTVFGNYVSDAPAYCNLAQYDGITVRLHAALHPALSSLSCRQPPQHALAASFVCRRGQARIMLAGKACPEAGVLCR